MPNTSREYLENCTYKFPSKRGIFRSQRSRIRQIFYFVIRILHRRPVLLLTSWIASTHFLFTLWPREKERQRTLRVPRIEQPRLGCSIFRRRTNVSLLRFSVTDGEPMVFLSMKFFPSLGWFISPSIGCLSCFPSLF